MVEPELSLGAQPPWSQEVPRDALAQHHQLRRPTQDRIASHRIAAPFVRCQRREKMKTNLGRKNSCQYQNCYAQF